MLSNYEFFNFSALHYNLLARSRGRLSLTARTNERAIATRGIYVRVELRRRRRRRYLDDTFARVRNTPRARSFESGSLESLNILTLRRRLDD